LGRRLILSGRPLVLSALGSVLPWRAGYGCQPWPVRL